MDLSKVKTLADYWQVSGMEVPADWAHQIKMTRTPREYQVLDLNHMASNTRSGLYNDPGLGKTLPAQAHVLWLVAQGNKAVCLMPPVLVQQFYESFNGNYLGVSAFVSISTYSGNLASRVKLLQEWDRSGWPQVVLCSFDLFCGKSRKELQSLVKTRLKHAEKRASGEGREITRSERLEIEKLSPADELGVDTWLRKGYNHLLIDEATAVKSPNSDLHRAVARFVGEDPKTGNGLVLMTGSPVENELTDLYGLIKLTWPDRYSSSRHFEAVHCNTVDFQIKKVVNNRTVTKRIPKIIGYKNEEYAYRSLYQYGRRVTKKDGGLNLPPRIMSEIQVRLSKPHQELYNQLAEERVLEIGDKVIDATTASSLYMKSQRILLCPELFHDEETKGPWKAENTLLTALDELVRSLGGRKLLVSAWFTDSIHALAKRYAKLNPAMIYGEVTGSAREQQKAKFIEDPTCTMMICNPRSGGVGIDGFQTVCSYLAVIEPVAIPGLLEQTLSRLHRSGQTAESVNVYLFTALSTVAVRLRNSLVNKESSANKVVRDAKTLLAELMGTEGIQGRIE